MCWGQEAGAFWLRYDGTGSGVELPEVRVWSEANSVATFALGVLIFIPCNCCSSVVQK